MVALFQTFLQPTTTFLSSSSSSSASTKLHPRFRVSSSYTTTTSRVAQMSSLYEVLGISATATGNEIKAAYRRLARACHPDVVATNKREGSANEFVKIHEAYSTLSDPTKRATYDRDLYGRTRAFGQINSSSMMMAASAASGVDMSPSRFSGFSRKRWESDQCW